MIYFSSVFRSIVLSLRSGRGVPARRVTDRREREPEGGARSPKLSCFELVLGRLSFLGDKFVVGAFFSKAPSSFPPVSLRKSFFHASSSMSSSIRASGSALDLIFPILKKQGQMALFCRILVFFNSVTPA